MIIRTTLKHGIACLSFVGFVACAPDASEATSESEIPSAVTLLESRIEASSQGVPSTKASAFFGDIAILNSTELGWTEIMSTTMKSANQRTLFIQPSLECGLYTNTTIRSRGGKRDTATASATIQMQVLVDGVPAAPGVVVYCSRTQQLSATLGGIIQSCADTDGDGTITASECELTDEELSLMLNTMEASSFNFGASVSSGVHTVSVQARISTSTTFESGTAAAYATIGKGSVLVTDQRL
jgi:hypothetical protein